MCLPQAPPALTGHACQWSQVVSSHQASWHPHRLAHGPFVLLVPMSLTRVILHQRLLVQNRLLRIATVVRVPRRWSNTNSCSKGTQLARPVTSLMHDISLPVVQGFLLHATAPSGLVWPVEIMPLGSQKCRYLGSHSRSQVSRKSMYRFELLMPIQQFIDQSIVTNK